MASENMAQPLILVTGGSGFIGVYCIALLLARGYRVRTTVRDSARQPAVRAMVARAMAGACGGADSSDAAALGFAEADLLHDAGWASAAAGCQYVLHVASPLPVGRPRHEDQLIIPAREGTLRVLRAARQAGVQRVVLTSSFAAIGYGHATPPQLDETCWTNLQGRGVSAYTKSKTLAERAAWDFLASQGSALELAAVNPVVVTGPVPGADYSASIELVRRLLDGAVPGCPRLQIGLVDVRDVADLHLRAMLDPAANGQRFLAIGGQFLWLTEVAQLLRQSVGAAARRVPTRTLPDWLVRAAALASPTLRELLPELGRPKHADSSKAARLLGWTPRAYAQSLADTAHSLRQFGLLKR